jgi:DNA-binding MarR family transcriptional regulator
MPNDTSDNPRRLLALMERLRPLLLGPAFRRLHELQLSPSHHRVLRTLFHTSPLAMKELAEQLSLTPPSVTNLTRRLVETGLVARRAHAEDSRVALLDLTDAGHQLHAELAAEQLQSMSRLLAALSPEEQQTLLDLLERAVSGAGPTPACHPPSPQ